MPLISPEELFACHADADCVVVDCRFDLSDVEAGRAAWLAAHVPGAHYAHLDEDLAAPAGERGGRHPLPAPAVFARRLADWGITENSLVVAYDDSGAAIAGRLWWLLRTAGHDRVAVLDGGFRAWRAAELPVESGPVPARPVPVRDLRLDRMPSIDAEQLGQALRDDGRVLIDVRAPQRFAGNEEPLDRVAGHVPGALNLPLTGNLDADGRFLAPADLRRRFQAILGERPATQAVLMCGSGVSACQTLLAMECAGLRGAALYVGSWSDWISDPARPVARH